MPDHARQTGIAMEKTYPFMLWLVPTNDTLFLQGFLGGCKPTPTLPYRAPGAQHTEMKGECMLTHIF